MNKELLNEIIEYIENVEVDKDYERGYFRCLNTLILYKEMPELYNKLIILRDTNMEELEIQLEQVIKYNQTILEMEAIDYDYVNRVRKVMYDTALAYLILKNKTVLLKRLSWKNASNVHIMGIVERSLVQLRYDLKSEVDVKLLKFIVPN